MHTAAATVGSLARERFCAFYDQTAPGLRRYLARIAGTDIADDLLQEAYIRLIDAAPGGEPERRAWLYRTATNLAMDHFRALRRERIGLAFWRSSRPVAVEPPDPSSGVERAFRLLSVHDRALLWLAYVEEATHADIAAALGCGPRSVRVLLFRARRRLERIFREHNIDSGELP